jgi:hypothetical protein
MRVYISSWFGSRLERHGERRDLIEAGIECTSRWLDELPCAGPLEGREFFLQHTADIDVSDAIKADVVVMFTTDHNINENAHTGGRHFELGLAYGLMMAAQALDLMSANAFLKPVVPITVGPKENVFHRLSSIRNFPTWPEALAWLKEYSNEVDQMNAAIEMGLRSGALTKGEDAVAEKFHISKTVN